MFKMITVQPKNMSLLSIVSNLKQFSWIFNENL